MVDIKFNFGDKVKLRLAHEEVEGIALESYDNDVILIKLKSGYNIGIPKENILDFHVIEEFKANKRTEKITFGKSKDKQSIGMVITGGTIAAKLDSRTGGVSWLTDTQEFVKFYPKVFEKVNVKKISVPFMVASENMTSEHWITIAEHVKEMLNDPEIKGVIVTHGTDTLHYTSSALSFFLRDLKKPVVLTFSQRSIDRASSDAELNLECAVEMSLSNCAEVVLVGHATQNDDFCYAYRGTKVRKMHSSRRDAFKAINCEPIAKVFPNKIEFLSKYNARSDGLTKVDSSFSDKVALVYYYPGQDPSILDYYLVQGYRGIVIVATGFGHVATGDDEHSWIPHIKRLIKQGVAICFAPQTFYGRLNPKVYSPGRELEKLGVIYLEDLLPETALVKLGWVLGHKNWRSLVREKMIDNVCGEFNELLTE
ncbi:Glu-tRNA(Gln) amidotransferase subunit GatD [Candidatus Pacearchaeota archaeon]|nr:Glu-tRNA(Gln) amidotransferase subunit GatD [Candidatus Pacearchaeota archaeon]